jgi:hypothetical protein
VIASVSHIFSPWLSSDHSRDKRNQSIKKSLHGANYLVSSVYFVIRSYLVLCLSLSNCFYDTYFIFTQNFFFN